MATSITAQDLVRGPAVAEPVLRRPARSLWSDAWRQFRRHRLAMFGSFTFVALLLMVLVGPITTPPDASTIAASSRRRFATVRYRRPLARPLARSLIGGRVSMSVALSPC